MAIERYDDEIYIERGTCGNHGYTEIWLIVQ